MDTQELLNIIDIIKNEDLYNKRLRILQIQEESLKTTQFIVATVKQANTLRDEAKSLKEKAEQELVQIRKDAEEHKRQLDQNYSKQVDQLREQESLVDVKMAEAKTRLFETTTVKKDIEQLKAEVQKQYDHWKSEREKLRNERAVLKDRVKQINELIKDL